jgi:hypothetical protein
LEFFFITNSQELPGLDSYRIQCVDFFFLGIHFFYDQQQRGFWYEIFRGYRHLFSKGEKVSLLGGNLLQRWWNKGNVDRHRLSQYCGSGFGNFFALANPDLELNGTTKVLSDTDKVVFI